MFQEYTPYEWLLYSTAQNAGLKGSYEELMSWTEDNLSQLEDYEETADSPYMYMKDVRAIRNVQRGNSIHHIIYLDATFSGLQVMSLMQGCRKSMEQCNLIDTGVCQDPYTNIIPTMNELLPKECWITLGNEPGHFNRKDHVKPATMTLGYKSKAKPIEIFGENTLELKAFFAAIRENIPALLDIPNEILSMWNFESGEYQWRQFFNDPKNPFWSKCLTKPDKFQDPHRIQNIYGLKGSFSYLLDSRGEPSNYATPLVANTVQSFDANIIQEEIRRCNKSGFNILTIHDSVGCQLPYVNTVRKHYNNICADLYEGNVMSQLVKDLMGIDYDYKQKELGLGDLIRDANYALN
jgi:hypothetical protein